MSSVARRPTASNSSCCIVLADDLNSRLHVGRTRIRRRFRYPIAHSSSVRSCTSSNARSPNSVGVQPLGHPWLKPVRFSPARRRASGAAGSPGARNGSPTIGVADFYRVEGDEVHEVAVGPVHAGIIEPGHFRFQCHGEEVLHLEISLGYQHRGIEQRPASAGLTAARFHIHGNGRRRYDHRTWSGPIARAMEALERMPACPARAQTLRGVALELERLANHAGDLGSTGRRRWISAHRRLLRTAPWRIPQSDGYHLRKSVRTRAWSVPEVSGFDVDRTAGQATCSIGWPRRCDELTGAVELLFEFAVRHGAVRREPVRCRTGNVRSARPGWSRGPCLRRGTRCSPRSSDRRVSVSRTSRFRPGRGWRRVRPGACSMAARFSSRPDLSKSKSAHCFRPVASRCRPMSPTSRSQSSLSRWWKDGVEKSVTLRCNRRDEGRLEQSYKIVDPSFHNWTALAMALAGAADLRFPAVQQEFQSVLLRSRPVRCRCV